MQEGGLHLKSILVWRYACLRESATLSRLWKEQISERMEQTNIEI